MNKEDIDKLIKVLEDFKTEEISKIVNNYTCKNCGNLSQLLEIKKMENDCSEIDKLKEFPLIIDEHNRSIKKKVIGLIFKFEQESDKKWVINGKMDNSWLKIAKEDDIFGWINSYSVHISVRECYVTCPVCKMRNVFKIAQK